LPLDTRRRAIVAVLNEILGLHNKPKAVVHSVHKLTGPKKKKKKKNERKKKKKKKEEEEEEKKKKKRNERRKKKKKKKKKKKQQQQHLNIYKSNFCPHNFFLSCIYITSGWNYVSR